MHKNLSIILRNAIVLFALLIGLVLILFRPAALSPVECKAAAVAIVIISLWATGIIPEHLTALLFFLFAMLFHVSPPRVVFSGFASAAFWLIFGGLVIGVGITETGLGVRIASKIVARLTGSYAKLIGGVVAVGVLFSFLMPAALGRAVLLAPIAVEVAALFGFEKGSNGRVGIILAATLGSAIPGFAVLPANVVNMVLVGLAETQFDLTILYGGYLLLHFPVLGVLRALAIWGLILWLYPDRPRTDNGRRIGVDPISRQEVILAIITVMLLCLWMTDFMHKISPAWIAVAGALFLLSPGIGIVDQRQFNTNVNYGSLLYIAGLLGLGGMISDSGIGNVLAEKLVTSLPLSAGSAFLNYMLLSLSAFVTGIIATLPGVPAVLTPVADSFAQVTGLPVKTVLMTQVVGFSTTVFPYQIPSFVVGMQMAGEKLSHSAKFFLALTAVTIVLLMPLNYFWWRMLGWI